MKREDLSPEQQEEFDVLAERAKLMGIRFNPNIKLEALRKRVNAALEAVDENPDPESEGITPNSEIQGQTTQVKPRVKSAMQLQKEREAILRKMATRLIRVKITPTDPLSSELEGDIFQAANSFVNVKRYIPFNKPWHIEQILLDYIKGLKRQMFRVVKIDGKEVKKAYLTNAYVVDILPPLTEEEMKKLMIRQANAAKSEDEEIENLV